MLRKGLGEITLILFHRYILYPKGTYFLNSKYFLCNPVFRMAIVVSVSFLQNLYKIL